MVATTAAKITVALDDDLDGDLGGGDRGRVPASIAQRYHAATENGDAGLAHR